MVYQNKRVIDMLDEGTYKDYHYAIVSLGSHPCAYVELPKGHKWYGKDYDDIPVSCHGGLTYSRIGLLSPSSDYHKNGFWIGWDYAHYGDYCGWHGDFCSYDKKWATEEIFQEIKEVIEQLG